MTRFARAKGSKSSNERLPENATSWTEIKQQMQQKKEELEFEKKVKEANRQRDANYKSFLEETEAEQSKVVKWAEFPGAKTVSKKKVKNIKEMSSDDEEFSCLKNKVDKILDKNDSDSDGPPEEVTAKTEMQQVVAPKVKKPKKKLLNIVSNVKPESLSQNNEEKQDIPVLSEAEQLKKEKKLLRRRKQVEKKTLARQKRKLEYATEYVHEAKKPKLAENLPEEEQAKIERKKAKQLRQAEKRRLKRVEQAKQKEQQVNTHEETNTNTNKPIKREPQGGIRKMFEKPNNNNNTNKVDTQQETNTNTHKPIKRELQGGIRKMFENPNNNNTNNTNNKPGKVRDKEQHQRRKPQLPNKMMLNGKEVEVDYVDGFPVKREDAERLKQLKRQMIAKGLPQSEINAAMKMERRRAEKSFTREKQKVCFQCRKSGHMLSECPELDKNQVAQNAGTGICFKCGSTEHSHLQCKVVRGQEYKFASCFICNEQGHIARQCPDNARGLYPKGGACNECGDVTHLRKDCPRYQAQQQKETDGIHLETFNGGNPDAFFIC